MLAKSVHTVTTFKACSEKRAVHARLKFDGNLISIVRNKLRGSLAAYEYTLSVM
jgi:hypothetical protein